MVTAVFVLATGVKGLQSCGRSIWLPDFLNGAALLLAVGLANVERAHPRFGAIRQTLRMRRRVDSETAYGEQVVTSAGPALAAQS
jgi:ribose transport system permease protein